MLDGARVGRRALVAAGATVPPGMVVPDGMLAVGIPARVAGEVAGRARQWVETNPAVYRELARRHAAGARPFGPQPINAPGASPTRAPVGACPRRMAEGGGPRP